MSLQEPTLFEVPVLLTPEDLPREVLRPVFEEKRHRYTLDDVWLPGVTTILGVLDKPALPWWGMTVGVKGVIELLKSDDDLMLVEDALAMGDDAALVSLLTKHKLTVNHIKDAAGARGSTAHDVLEQFIKTGAVPDLAGIEEERLPYVRSAADFLITTAYKIVATEVMVWSEKHWYAGTFDALVRDAEGRLGLIDYKTSKRAYDSHLIQLCAYEGARRELGLEPVEFCAVVHISNEGVFDEDRHLFEISPAEVKRGIKDFQSIKDVYDRLKKREGRLKQLHLRMNPPKKRGRR